MIGHEPDGVGAEVEQLLLRAGAGFKEVAHQLALRRTAALRAAEAESQQRAAEAHRRFEAQRDLARAQFSQVDQDAWWQHTPAQGIVDMWQTATEWSEHDDVARDTATTMRSEMTRRFGFDPEDYLNEDRGAEMNTGETSVSTDASTERGAPAPAADVTPTAGAERAADVAAALEGLQEGQRLEAKAGQESVGDLVHHGGPRRVPRARKTRGRDGQSQERQRER